MTHAHTSKWNPGQCVMARDVGSHRMRRAWVMQPRPYVHPRGGTITDGAYISWADLVHDAEHDRIHGTQSSGGWCYELADGWDDGAAALDAFGFALRCVGQFIVDKSEREKQATHTIEIGARVQVRFDTGYSGGHVGADGKWNEGNFYRAGWRSAKVVGHSAIGQALKPGGWPTYDIETRDGMKHTHCAAECVRRAK